MLIRIGGEMDSKLTLKLDADAINGAKLYAKIHNSSLSRLVEKFFFNLAKEDKKTFKASPVVQELSGIIEEKKIPKDSERLNYLLKKHS